MKRILFRVLLPCCLLSTAIAKGQEQAPVSLPDKLFSHIDREMSGLGNKMDRQTARYLDKLERQEKKLQRRLSQKDTALAKQLFDGSAAHYQQLKNAAQAAQAGVANYSGRLDSLMTGLDFLKSGKIPGLAGSAPLEKAAAQCTALQNKLEASEHIKTYLHNRQQMLEEQFGKLGMVRQLKSFRKQAYYYQAQMKAYKALLNDPDQLEARLLAALAKLPAFRQFFAKNSMISSLFVLPGNGSTVDAPALAGLSTRASVNQALASRLGQGMDVNRLVQQNTGDAQATVNSMRNQLQKAASGDIKNGNPTLPDYKVNSQKTKSFKDRLVFGADIQSQKARYYFPATTDIGVSVGYQLNDKSVVSTGISYKLGLGRGWDHLALSSQGIGLRTALEWQLKGSLYISGGYELNHKSMFHSIDELKDRSAWQKSGLIGLARQYKIGKMKGELKFLWDFLSQQQVPKTQPFVFRVGYSFK